LVMHVMCFHWFDPSTKKVHSIKYNKFMHYEIAKRLSTHQVLGWWACIWGKLMRNQFMVALNLTRHYSAILLAESMHSHWWPFHHVQSLHFMVPTPCTFNTSQTSSSYVCLSNSRS
jgi:hypothetical protein